MKMRPEDVVVCVPCYTGDVAVETVNGIVASVPLFHDVLWQVGCCSISLSRDRLAHDFLNTTTAKKMVFVDTDIVFSAEQFKRLIGHDEPIVSGVYVKRNTKSELTFEALKDGDKPSGRGLFRVKRAATGFMSITRDALTKIRGDNMDRWYKQDGERLFDFFPHCRSKDEYPTDDFGFCELAEKSGIPIHVDLGLNVGHRGHMTYSCEFAL